MVFGPPTHLGKIIDLIRSGFQDLTWGGGTILFGLNAERCHREPPAVCRHMGGCPKVRGGPRARVLTCWAPQNTVFFCQALYLGKDWQLWVK